MNNYKTVIKPNDAFNVWVLDKVSKVPYESPSETIDNEIYQQIGVQAINMREIADIIYPVREKFLTDDVISHVTYKEGEFTELYFPWENRKVNFSTFCHDPHVLSIYAKNYIYSEKDMKIELDVHTCGAVKIWCNKEETLLYKPYLRNVPEKTTFIIDLKAGENEILVYANDLAERDVFFYFELVNKSDENIVSYVKLKEPQENVDHAKKILESMYFEEDSYSNNLVKLCYDAELLADITEMKVGPNQEKILINPAENYVLLNNSDDVIDGFDVQTISLGLGTNTFNVSLGIGDITLTRTLFVALFPSDFKINIPEKSIEGRKKQTLELFNKIKPDNFISSIISILEQNNIFTHECREIMESELSRIEARLDCADFRLPIIFNIYLRYNDILPEDIKLRIKETALNFRYWTDEPGNDVMWYFSENHAMLFHVSQYLAGHIFKDEIFTNSNRTSKEQREIGRDRLIKWFEEFSLYGFSEWNSLTYLPVDLIGFFVLYNIAFDDEIKSKAKSALDMTFGVISSNLHNNAYATSYGRIYEKYLKSIDFGELAMDAWIAYGQGKVNNRNKAVSLFCISDYVPPMYSEIRDLSDGKTITIERLQGYHNTYTYLHKNSNYSLASAQNFYPYSKGVQQHMINLSFSDEEISVWINHPGEKVFSGENRPSYWGGNDRIPLVEQYKNTLIGSFEIQEEDDVHFIHAYLPVNKMDEVRELNNWFIFRNNDAYGAIYFSNGYSKTIYGANTNKELISNGLRHVVVLKVGSKDEYESFDEFVKLVDSIELLETRKDLVTLRDYEHGTFEMKINDGLYLNGEKILREATKEMLVTIE